MYKDTAYNTQNLTPQARTTRTDWKHEGLIYPFTFPTTHIPKVMLDKFASRTSPTRDIDLNYDTFWTHQSFKKYRPTFTTYSMNTIVAFIKINFFILMPITLVTIALRESSSSSPNLMVDGLCTLYLLISTGIFICTLFSKCGTHKDRLYGENSHQSVLEYELNRMSGMVTRFTSDGVVDYSYPFIEFDCIYTFDAFPRGITEKLVLAHRYDASAQNLELICSYSIISQEDYVSFYNVIQYYMDISKPLPDMWRLEKYRCYDPTTQEADRKNNRDPKFWRKKTGESFEEAIKTYMKKNSQIAGPTLDIFEDEVGEPPKTS